MSLLVRVAQPRSMGSFRWEMLADRDADGPLIAVDLVSHLTQVMRSVDRR
jgi:hypothetical protein